MITKIKRKIVDYLENRKARIEVERTRKLAEAEGLIIRCPAFTDFFEVVLDTPDEVHFVKQKAENLGVEIEFKYDSDPNSTYEMPIGMKVKAVRLF